MNATRLEFEPVESTITHSSYVILVETYGGDADVRATMHVEALSPTELLSRIVELYIVASQFPNGRGGCRAMYHQPNYFPVEAVTATTGDPKAFVWLDDLPYFEPGDINYTISELGGVEWRAPSGIQVLKHRALAFAPLEAEIRERMTEIGKKHSLLGYDAKKIYGSLDRDDITDLVVDNGYLDDVLALRNEMISKYQFAVSHG